MAFLRDRRVRDILVQAAVLAAVAGLVLGMALTARANLAAQGMATGFGFLERSTGWPINFSLIEVSDRSSYARMLLAGLLNTLFVGIAGLAGATVVGVAVGLARISTNLILNLLGTVFVEIFRNVPLILQVIFWYAILTHLPAPRGAIDLLGLGFLSNRGLMLPTLAWSRADLVILGAAVVAAALILRRLGGGWRGGALAAAGLAALGAALLLAGHPAGAPYVSIPELQGLRFVGGVTVKPEFAALLIGITVFGGAYVGEIVRAGFLSVEGGRLEAGRALGLSDLQVSWFVRIPLAIRAMLPALSNQYVWLMKATTLGVAIGYPDYFMVISTSINQSGQTLELLLLLMGGFLLVNFAIGGAMNALNARLKLKGQG